MVIGGKVTVIPSNASGARVTDVGVAPLTTSSACPEPVGARSPVVPPGAERVIAAAGRCGGDWTAYVAIGCLSQVKDVNEIENGMRAIAPAVVLFCSSSAAARPGAACPSPPNWVASERTITSAAATIAATAWRTAAMSSVPDHASAQQWISLTSVRAALPRSSRVWVMVAAACGVSSLSGSVRPTYNLRNGSRSVVFGPSYTVTGGVAAPSEADAVNAVTSQ